MPNSGGGGAEGGGSTAWAENAPCLHESGVTQGTSKLWAGWDREEGRCGKPAVPTEPKSAFL